MAYQALLFCPEEKTARTVTQVLAELEFSVEPCTEPFAAVKKLMSQHFDAIVVDCDNEQNATLLFKSARNSTSNQASLAVAIVEGQAGVAKAFRIGANLVLTKPINVEQSKGTLRVARGLLRKGEPGKPAPAPAPVAAAPVPSPATPPTAAPAPVKPLVTRPMPAAVKPATPAATGVRPAPPARPAAVLPPRPTIPAAAKTVASPAAETAPGLGSDPAPAVVGRPSVPSPSVGTPATGPIAPKPSVIGGTTTFSSGAASAPAPAREPQVSAPVAADVQTRTLETASIDKPKQSAAFEATLPRPEPPAPSFTFGGANTAEPSSGPGKKIVLGLVAAIALAAAAYAGWNYYQGHSRQFVAKTTQPAAIAPKPTAPQPVTPAPAQAETAAPVSQPESQTAETTAPSATDSATAAEPVEEKPARPAKTSPKPSAAATPKNAPTVAEEAPLFVKSGSQPHVQPAAPVPDASAPSVIGLATPSSDGALTNIVADQPAAKPVLQAMKISQGVAQGLIMKRVAPEYPRSALTMRIEGAVELAATISKEGEIKDVKVLKGDPQLSRAAVQAVKQWKYKPYLLNGEPVEIQTQITVNFNLPK